MNKIEMYLLYLQDGVELKLMVNINKLHSKVKQMPSKNFQKFLKKKLQMNLIK